MAIPDYQAIMLPLLKLVTLHRKIELKDARSLIAGEFKLSEQDKAALLPSCKSSSLKKLSGVAAGRGSRIHALGRYATKR